MKTFAWERLAPEKFLSRIYLPPRSLQTRLLIVTGISLTVGFCGLLCSTLINPSPTGSSSTAMPNLWIENLKQHFLAYALFLGALAGSTIIAIRQSIKRLTGLAAAAEALKPDNPGPALVEHGPSEVRELTRAFNSLSERIADHLNDRLQVLTAFSHDMQTPITRMRLRAEMAPEFPDRLKFLRDLEETERLIREGIAYARGIHVQEEKIATIEISSFIQTIAMDYQDTGRAVSVISDLADRIRTKPRALRRILSNFIDNSLKFTQHAEIDAHWTIDGQLAILVLDRGPGIDESLLEAVKKPFVKLRQARHGETPGIGLGLAIADQLAKTAGGTLNLRNRSGGGLIAEILIEDTGSAKNYSSERSKIGPATF